MPKPQPDVVVRGEIEDTEEIGELIKEPTEFEKAGHDI